jgi:hypothetical protein
MNLLVKVSLQRVNFDLTKFPLATADIVATDFNPWLGHLIRGMTRRR